MTVKIIADSTCDLTPELLAKFDVDIIPLHVILGEDTFEDGVNISSPQVIEWSNKNNATPKTAAPSTKSFFDHFQPYLDAGRHIICITVGSGFSATYQSAKLAAQELASSKIHIFDTKNLSSGGGHMVLIAAEMAQQGATVEEIIAKLKTIRPKVRASFFVDRMTFLYRGGRCNAVAAFSANTLNIKPQILVKDGAMIVGRKFRGSTLRVCKTYCEAVLKNIEQIDPKRVIVTVSPSTPELVETAYKVVESMNYFDEIIVTYAGSVITSHCGENTLGVLYIEK